MRAQFERPSARLHSAIAVRGRPRHASCSLRAQCRWRSRATTAQGLRVLKTPFSSIRTILIASIVVLTCADHLTTWLCLSEPVEGWTVSEANPIARWIFLSAGLVPGLLIDTLITVAALTFVAATPRFSPTLKTSMLSFVTLVSFYAVTNNVLVIADLGIGPSGI